MNDPLSVCCVECVRNLDGKRQDQFEIHRSSRNLVLQRQPVQKLHDDETLASMLPNLVDGADIWVVQCGSGTCFPAKPFQSLRVLGYILGQKLQGNKAAKLSVLGLVDHTHAPTADLFDDAVMRDGLADQTTKLALDATI